MIIAGVEVIRRNPGSVAITNNPGSVEVAPPEKLELTYGDILRIITGFEYRGPKQDITLYGAIGTRGWAGFDEIIANEAKYETPDSPAEFVPVTASVDIPITADIAPEPNYDIYCKIKEYPEAGYPEVDDVIDIVGIPPTYELLEETIYPYAYVYDGPWDGGIFTFKSDPFTPASWIAGKFAAHCEAEVKKAGGRVLETRVYVDRTPLLWTNWRVEVIGISPTTTAGLGITVGVVWWVAVLLVILGLIALIVTATWAWKETFGKYEHKGISPELKEPMSRETLTTLAHDYEAKLEETKPEFTPKPPEEIEAMSDDELRDYCDQLAEWIVPPVPPVPWELLAVLGVLGIGGVAAAYALSKRPEGAKRE